MANGELSVKRWHSNKQLSPKKLQTLLVREKVEAARRAMLLYPQQLSWNWWDDVTVEIRFWLPAGSFATSVVRELINTTGDYAHIAE